MPCFPHGRNSRGIDLGNPTELSALGAALDERRQALAPIIGGIALPGEGHPVTNPADRRDAVGSACEATTAQIAAAFDAGDGVGSIGCEVRAGALDKAADLLEARRDEFFDPPRGVKLGKTLPDAISEVREAADFCRYYAVQARNCFAEPAR